MTTLRVNTIISNSYKAYSIMALYSSIYDIISHTILKPLRFVIKPKYYGK